MIKFYQINVRALLIVAMAGLFGLSAHAQFPAPYCAAAFASGVEPITLVNFAGIANTTSPTIAGGTAMEDFTAMTGTVARTLSYPITLKGNTDGDFTNYFSVFIDWNQDGDFADTGETYNIGTIISSNGTDAVQLTGNISVPVGAALGTTRMRVAKRFNSNPVACNTAGFGQSEDYSLTVNPAPPCLQPSAVQVSAVTKNSVTVTWTAPSSTPSAGYQLYYSTVNTAPTDATVPNGGSSTGLSAVVTGLQPLTQYYVWVRSACDADGESVWSSAPAFTTLCDYPDVTATVPGVLCGQGTAELEATASAGELFWYDAATGGNFLGSGSPFTTPSITETTNFFVSAGTVSPNMTVPVGLATLTSGSGGNSPYYHGWGGVKTQYIIRASELTAAGMAPGPINSLSFTITTLGTATFNNFAVSIGATTQNAATTTHVGGLTTVYTNAAQPLTMGLNTYTFNAPYTWDGSSNIVVQTCYSNVNYGGTSSAVQYSNPGFVAATYTYADNQSAAAVCATTTGGVNGSGSTLTVSARPRIIFNASAVCSGPRQAVTATVNTADEIVAVASDAQLCPGESTTLSVTSDNDDYTYEWMPGNLVGADQTVSPAETTIYTVTATDVNTNCVTSETVTVIISPSLDPITIAGDTSACEDEIIPLSIAGMTAPVAYCTPIIVGYPEDSGDYIGSFTFANITNNNSGDAESDYTYYSDLTANVTADGSTQYPISFTAGGSSSLYAQQFGAWIDFNQNGVFETSEMVYASTTSSFSPTVSSGMVTIPTTARTGVTRMRIASRYSSAVAPGEACQIGTTAAVAWGEFEDYNVNISGGLEYVWSPQTGLFTDAEATIPYTGTSATMVYAQVTASETYTVTATTGAGCTVSDSITIDMISTPAPTGDDEQLFTFAATVADLEATGTAIQWYADATGGTPLASDTALVEGETYFASQTENGCESNIRFEVTVTIDLPMMDWVNLQWPATLDITEGSTGDVYAQAWEPGVTEAAGAGAGVTAWIGVSSTNDDPSTWTTWIPATFNMQVDNNDEFTAAIGTGLTPGTYYYASRFQLNDGPFSYGGYNASGGGFWDGTANVSGVLTVSCFTAAPTLEPTAEFCDMATVADLETVATGSIVWYADETGGNALPSETPLVDGQSYYGALLIDNCESTTRTEVEVTINTSPVVIAPDDVTLCNQEYILPDLAVGDYYLLPDGQGVMLNMGDIITSTTTIYVFASSGTCSDEESFTVTIDNVAAPTGETTQVIAVDTPEDATIEDIVVEETGVVWYATEQDAIDGVNPLPTGTQLVTGETYYGTLTVDACTSDPLAVTIDVQLGAGEFDAKAFNYYPNPVKDVLNLQYSTEITSVSVFNLLGQNILNKKAGTMTTTIDLSAVADGTYIVKVTAGDAVKTIKVIKKQ